MINKYFILSGLIGVSGSGHICVPFPTKLPPLVTDLFYSLLCDII